MAKRVQEVPSDRVFRSVADAVNQYAEDFPAEYWKLRQYVTNAVATRRESEGWSFDKGYRHEVSPAHSLIYALVATVAANYDDRYAIDRYFEGMPQL